MTRVLALVKNQKFRCCESFNCMAASSTVAMRLGEKPFFSDTWGFRPLPLPPRGPHPDLRPSGSGPQTLCSFWRSRCRLTLFFDFNPSPDQWPSRDRPFLLSLDLDAVGREWSHRGVAELLPRKDHMNLDRFLHILFDRFKRVSGVILLNVQTDPKF